jgi:hypothetical protein
MTHHRRDAMLKYLRIAVTALSLTACALLVALWVRSYTWNDIVSRIEISGAFATLGSSVGRAYVVHGSNGPLPGADPTTFPQTNFSTTRERSLGWRSRSGFEWKSHPRYRVVYCPYWFLVFIAVSVAVAPWIHWSRRFSLRTLLIVTTLVAVGLRVVIMMN